LKKTKNFEILNNSKSWKFQKWENAKCKKKNYEKLKIPNYKILKNSLIQCFKNFSRIKILKNSKMQNFEILKNSKYWKIQTFKVLNNSKYWKIKKIEILNN